MTASVRGTEFLRGKVAKVVDAHRVIVNRGLEHGVTWGEYWVIGLGVVDPDTGEYLGTADRLRVRITEVFPKYSVAETYEKVSLGSCRCIVSVSVGDSADRAEETQRP